MATMESDVSNYLNDPNSEPLPTYTLHPTNTTSNNHHHPHGESNHSTSQLTSNHRDTGASWVSSSSSSSRASTSSSSSSETFLPPTLSRVNLVKALFLAISNTQDDVANHLLTTYSHIINANSRNLEGKTPLAAAVETGNTAIVAMVLNHGAEVDAWSVQGKHRVLWDIHVKEKRKKEMELAKKRMKEQEARRKEEEKRQRAEVVAYYRRQMAATGGDGDEDGDPGISRPFVAPRVETGSAAVTSPAPPPVYSHPSQGPQEEVYTLHPEYQILRTPLMIASTLNFIPLVHLLLNPPCNANPSLVAPDGQTSLRLASSAGNREIVQILPSLRAGGLKRFKHQHATSMHNIRRTTHVLKEIAVFVGFRVPRALLYKLPKWAAKKTWKVLKWVVLVAIPKTAKATGTFVFKTAPKAIFNGTKAAGKGSWNFLRHTLPHFLFKTLPKFLVKCVKALWNFLIHTFPKFMVKLGKALWRFFTHTLPHAAKWVVVNFVYKILIKGSYKCTKALLKFLWKCLTVHFPRFCRAVGERILALIVGTYHLLKRGVLSIVSLVHTAVMGVVTFFRGIRLADVWNGVKDVGRWVFVEVPCAVGRALVGTLKCLAGGVVAVFGGVGWLLVMGVKGVVYLVTYVPRKAGEVLVEYGRVVKRGVREVVLWVNPKAMM